MKYLKPFALLEQEAKPNFLNPTPGQLEALPAWRELQDLYAQLEEGSEAGIEHHLHRAISPERRAKDPVKKLEIFQCRYVVFSLNPRSRTLYYGMEKVNKNFELKFDTLEDWNKAIEIAGLFAMARVFLSIDFDYLLRMLKDPKKFWEKEVWPGSAEEVEIIKKYLLDHATFTQTDLERYFVSRLQKNISFLGEIPANYDKSNLLQQAGYSQEEAQSLLLVHDMLGF